MFAVAAEEFGIILCLAMLALFAFVIIRTLSRAYANDDMFSRSAASGLAILFGVQAAIKMSVNLQLKHLALSPPHHLARDLAAA